MPFRLIVSADGERLFRSMKIAEGEVCWKDNKFHSDFELMLCNSGNHKQVI
jgi:hypothetical protein